MGTPFSGARALGVPPQDYDSYFADAEPFAYAPDRGYSARPSMITQDDPIRDQMRNFAADQSLQTLDAQQDLLNNGAEALVTPEGRNKRLDYMLRGAITPQQERTIEHFETAPRQPVVNKYSPVPHDVAKAAAELDYIDPTEDGALEKRNAILRAIDENPEYGGPGLKTHPYFQDKDQKFLHNYYAHKHLTGTAEHSAEKADLGEIHKALTTGASADDLRPYLDPEMKRITDRPGFSQVLAESARRKAVMTPAVQKKMLELQLAAEQAEATNPSVPQKEAWLSSQGIEEPTAADWSAAWRALKVGPMQEYLAFQRSLGLGARPAAPVEPAAAPTPEPQAAAPAASGPIRVVTTADYQRVPSGAIYIGPDGQSRRKK